MINSTDIAQMIDHSMLQPYLEPDEVLRGCDTALRYRTASVCARPCDMAAVARRLEGSGVHACTVIGFPHGTALPSVKLFESKQALDDGATELDMVINVGRLIAGDHAYIEDEIQSLCELAHSNGALLKVILENCWLTPDKIRLACGICSRCGVDFVKTSTGYGRYGARLSDIAIMRSAIAPEVRIKAAGGIRTLDMLLCCRFAGCARCGASATEAIMSEALRREAEGTLAEKTSAEFEAARAAENA